MASWSSGKDRDIRVQPSGALWGQPAGLGTAVVFAELLGAARLCRLLGVNQTNGGTESLLLARAHLTHTLTLLLVTHLPTI